MTLGAACFTGFLSAQDNAVPSPQDSTSPLGLPEHQSPDPVSPAADIASLIEMLSSDNWPDRAKATAQLLELGPPVLPILLKAAESEGIAIDTRRGLESVMADIRAAQKATPLLVTIRGKDVDAKELYRQLSVWSGIPIDLNSRALRDKPLKRVDIDLRNVPFWSAVREIALLTDVGPSNFYSQHLQLTTSPGWHLRPAFEAGPFLIIVEHIEAQTIRSPLSHRPGHLERQGRLHLLVLVDPNLSIAPSSPHIVLSSVRDLEGRELLDASTAFHVVPDHEDRPTPWMLRFRPSLAFDPAREATGVRSIEGFIQLKVITESQTVRFDDVLKIRNQTQTSGQNTVTLVDVRLMRTATDSVYEVHLDAALQPPAHYNDDYRDKLHGVVHLLDRDQRRLDYRAIDRNLGPDAITPGGGRVRALMGFTPIETFGDPPLVGEPYSLVWDIPTRFQRLRFQVPSAPTTPGTIPPPTD